MRRELPSLGRLRELLSYDASTGLFTWKVTKANAIAGTEAGCRQTKSIVVGIDGVLYRAHRLAWLHFYGELPPTIIDHINLNPIDNRIANLRAATPTENNANSRRRSHNKSGFKGVFWNAVAQKWQARVRVHGKVRHLGLFEDPALANEAYRLAAIEVFGDFARSE